jgi:hypothetical protein
MIFDILLHIAELVPATWLQMCIACPEIGRHSLFPGVQNKMKEMFIRKIKEKFNTFDIILFRLPNGWLHSINGQSAYIEQYADGITHVWYYHDKVHRLDDKPAFINSNGTQIWYHHGQKHRDNDEPAHIDLNGTRVWYYHDQKHRDNDKPAFMGSDGTCQYWKNNVQYTHATWK